MHASQYFRFLDASKAFDGTNHNLLFKKLKRNVSILCIVRPMLPLRKFYTEQMFVLVSMNILRLI